MSTSTLVILAQCTKLELLLVSTTSCKNLIKGGTEKQLFRPSGGLLWLTAKSNGWNTNGNEKNKVYKYPYWISISFKVQVVW